MRLGPGVNANTSFDETVYMLHVPTDNPEAMSKAFLFFADSRTGLSFDPEEIDKERGVIIEEWRQGRGADARMQDKQFPVLLKGSRYAERVADRHAARAFERFKPEALKRFYTDWYRPDLMAVVAVGDFDKADDRAADQASTSARSRRRPSRGRGRPSRCPTTPDTLFAVATDPEATMTTVGRLQHAAAARPDDRRRLPAAAGRAALHGHAERAAVGADAASPTRRSSGPAPQRGLFVRTKEAATLMALVSEDGIERGPRGARHRVGAGGAVRLHRRRARARAARRAARLRGRVRGARQGGVGRPRRRVHPQLHRRRSRCPASPTSTAWCSASCPRSRSTRSTRSRKDWAERQPRRPGERARRSPASPCRTRSASWRRRSRARPSGDVKPYVDVAARPAAARPAAGSRARSSKTTTRDAFGITEWELSNGVQGGAEADRRSSRTRSCSARPARAARRSPATRTTWPR